MYNIIYNFKENQRGIALMVILAVMVMLALIGTAAVMTSQVEVDITGHQKRNTAAFYAAEAGAEWAVKKILWNDYIAWSDRDTGKAAGELGNLPSYRKFLDQLGLYDGGEFNLPNMPKLGCQESVEGISMNRQDFGTSSTNLQVESTGGSGSARRNVILGVEVKEKTYEGLGFVLLSRNVNCVLCHGYFDNVERYNDPGTGTYDRVRLAALEYLNLRENTANSFVGGTVYTRGITTDHEGNPLSNLSSSTFKGYKFDDQGNIDDAGGLQVWDLNNATGTPLPPLKNLYLNYPTGKDEMTDGIVPESFPPPFPDDNGNKLIEDREFEAIVGNGSISGGIIYAVAEGDVYAEAGLPTTGNTISSNLEYSGNLVLVGPENDPLVINDRFVVDGDVVIAGKIKGEGELYVRGNVYIVGDLTYSDGTDGSGNRTFGIADDSTENSLRIAAGGNIIVGDHLTPIGGNIYDPRSRDLGDGTVDLNSDFSFTLSEISIFNRMEWTQFQSDPNYIPRYYTHGPGDPVYIYNKYDPKQGKGTYWDPSTNTWKGDEYPDEYDLSVLTQKRPEDMGKAAIINLAPNNGWLGEEKLKSFCIEVDNARTDGDPFKIDGLLYTSNALIAFARDASKIDGRANVNGAIVAADCGILVPKHLQINYDQRVGDILPFVTFDQVYMVKVSCWAGN